MDNSVTLMPPAVAVSVALNVPVFPCKPDDKAPYTNNGFKNASNDSYQIKEWWEQYPDALIAMPTGSVSGLVVADIDMKDGKDGGASLATLEAEYEPLPQTIETLTPTGGLHKYFLYPNKRIHTSAGKIGVGLDIRGDGGYVIIPPSKGYHWEASNPEKPADMPEWLIDLANKPKRKNDKFALEEYPIVRKGKFYRDRLPNLGHLHSFPDGKHEAVLSGWTIFDDPKYPSKKGRHRMRIDFIIYVMNRSFVMSAYHEINLSYLPKMKGKLSISPRTKLAIDIQTIAGHVDEYGLPIQLNFDDVDMDIFGGKRLLVELKKTKSGYFVIDKIAEFLGHLET